MTNVPSYRQMEKENETEIERARARPFDVLDEKLKLLRKAAHEMFSQKERIEDDISKLAVWIIATKQIIIFNDEVIADGLVGTVSDIINKEIAKLDRVNEIIRKAEKEDAGI